jgi:nicotinate-nucleotide pyrophosphorylase (carboxylating)
VTHRELDIDIEADARALARRALAEDGDADVTSEVAGAAGMRGLGVMEFRDGGVFAGRRYADAVARQCGDVRVEWLASDGDLVAAGSHVGNITGDLAQILRAERPMLNMLQRACGIASTTRTYVDAVAGTGCGVLHTRKTTPGLRGLEISAVLAGGGQLHRSGLSTEVLLKDNHWHALRQRGLSLRGACDAARSRGITEIYVEVESEDQLREACDIPVMVRPGPRIGTIDGDGSFGRDHAEQRSGLRTCKRGLRFYGGAESQRRGGGPGPGDH